MRFAGNCAGNYQNPVDGMGTSWARSWSGGCKWPRKTSMSVQNHAHKASHMDQQENTAARPLEENGIKKCPLCHSKEVHGSELEFIAWIHRDGSGVTPMVGKDTTVAERQTYSLNCLSITQDTYIASGFNSYVVRLRKHS